MNDLIVKDNEIKNMIYEIRGKQVMLDSDLAKLNIERFPEDFYFHLTKDEYDLILRSQNVTLELEQGKYSKYLPYVFTEQRIYMLSTILKSKIATQVTINIMDAFVAMRHFIGNNLIVQNNINNMVLKHDNEINKNTEDIKLLQDTFNNFIKPEEKNKIFFKGQIYDAYSLLLDIFYKSKKVC